MTEQEYIDACDLRTWRCVSSVVRWLQPSEKMKQVQILINEEIERLEPLVGVAMER